MRLLNSLRNQSGFVPPNAQFGGPHSGLLLSHTRFRELLEETTCTKFCNTFLKQRHWTHTLPFASGVLGESV